MDRRPTSNGKPNATPDAASVRDDQNQNQTKSNSTTPAAPWQASMAERLASSVSSLARDALAPDRSGAASTLSRNLNANGKSNGLATSSSAGTAASEDLYDSARSGVPGASGSASRSGLGESFRSVNAERGDEYDNPLAPAMGYDDLVANGSMQVADPLAALSGPELSKGKGKAPTGGNMGSSWRDQFQRDSADDIARIYGSRSDGRDVVGILSDPSFDLDMASTGLAEEKEPSAEDLFGPTASTDGQEGLGQAFRAQESSRLFPSNPDILSEMTGITAREEGESSAATEAWLSGWSEVLEHYTEYVWSPEEKRLLAQAQQEMEKLKEARQKDAGPQDDDRSSQAVRRLRQILGHINPKAAMRSRAASAASEGAAAWTMPHSPAQPLGQQSQQQRANERGLDHGEALSRSPSPESWD